MLTLIIGGAIMSAIIAVIGALFLQLAYRMTIKESLAYGEAWVATFAACFVTVVITGAFAYLSGADPAETSITQDLVQFVVGIVIFGLVFSWRLSLTIGYAILVALVMNVLLFLFSLLLGLVLAGAGAAA